MRSSMVALPVRVADVATRAKQALVQRAGALRTVLVPDGPLQPVGHPAAHLMSWKHNAIAGYVLIALTFGVMGIWSLVARLDRAVVSPGTINEENSRKTVQHYEGGIVREILVKEGQSVKQGDVVLRLNPVQARASYDLFRGQLDSLLVQEARLTAERDGRDDLELPSEMVARADESAAASIIRDQRSQFKERQASLQGQIGLLQARIQQMQDEVSGIEIERASTEAQVGFINQELVGLRALRDKQLIPVSRLLAMERERTRLEGVIGHSATDKAKAQATIGEAGLQITQIKQKFQEDVAGQLLETRQKMAELREKLAVAQDVFARLDIRAPRSGVIQGLKVYTVGQVIRAGEPLMEIVPDDDNLVVHVQFAPSDMETVHAGMQAEIKFPSFHSRRIPVILGKIESVSHDRLIDDATHQPYFLGIVQINKLQVPDMMQGRLVAGMPAEVVITTGERTAFSYMVAPLFEAMGHSFNEH